MCGFSKCVSVSATYSPGGGEWFPYGHRISPKQAIKQLADLELEEVHANGMILASGPSDSEEEEWVCWTFWLPEEMPTEMVGRFAHIIGWCKPTFSRD